MTNVPGRRAIIRGLSSAGAVFALLIPADRVEAQRTRRIGFLIGDAPTMIAAFENELQALGYRFGGDLVVEKRVSRANTADLPMQAAELARLKLDLVVAAALPQALEMRRADPEMPMVIATAPGLVSNGFAQSIERPGGRYTGMEELPPGVTERRVRLLKTVAPQLSRVALLSTTPGRGGHEAQVAEAEATARTLGLTVKTYRAASLNELKAALSEIVADKMEGFVNFQGGLSLANRELIVDFAAKNRLPAVYQSAFFPEAGGLMAWSPDQEEQYRIAARYVDQILKGAKPGDLPIRHPERYLLILNTRAARDLGLVLPASILSQADRVLP